MIIHEDWHGFSGIVNEDPNDIDYGVLYILRSEFVVATVKVPTGATNDEISKLYDSTIWKIMENED
jgi:hypothetical protein|tara:strand:+ start:289 stop:486 length:198 start_codon:yes stop_codon:yes gene_type:complete